MTPHHPAGLGPLSWAWSAVVLLLACALLDGSRIPRVIASVSPVSASPLGSRTVRVTVVNDKGAPVPDLTISDFELKEDGKTRVVQKVEWMVEPLSVALLLDDRGSDINEIRSGLAAFVARVQGRAEVSLVSVVPTELRVFDSTAGLARRPRGWLGPQRRC